MKQGSVTHCSRAVLLTLSITPLFSLSSASVIGALLARDLANGWWCYLLLCKRFKTSTHAHMAPAGFSP
uniref:Putative secreted protein n=1 Tax=Rhipicephalus microplus TaxID=6941 RepID=A0A6M2DBU1_RHIMP